MEDDGGRTARARTIGGVIDPAALPPGLVLPVRTDPEGRTGPTPDCARGRKWRRTSHGYYVPADVDGTRVEQRIVEAAVLVPARHAITGWAALRWMGGRWFGGRDPHDPRIELPVTINIGTRDIRRQRGIALSGESLDPRLIVWHRGLPVSVPTYSVSFEMRYADDEVAAARILDLACYSDLVSIDEQDRFLTPGQNAWTGVPKARDAIALADENTWSPTEFDLRQEWIAAAGGRRPRCNVPVFDLEGRFVATPDVIDVAHGVFGEYQGRVHLDVEQRDDDVGRDERLLDLGLEGAIMTAPDLRRPDAFRARVRRAYARADARAGVRRWTVVKPSWWRPTETVAQRRALSDVERARFLRYRAS